jgi:hypothetical protein
MDRAQLLNDSEEALRLAFDGRLATLWTAMPGIVQSVDLATMTLSVQPAIQGQVEGEDGKVASVNLPLLIHVPIQYPMGGGFALTLPVAVGDEVLIIWSARCIDAWWQSGGIQRPMEARMHDISDGFAILGIRSQPNVLENISATKLQLRNEAGTVFFSVGTKFSMTNATTDLKTVLTDLQTLLNTFMGVLAGFAGGGSPTTQAMLQAPAATAQTSLAAVLVKIGALLE